MRKLGVVIAAGAAAAGTVFVGVPQAKALAPGALLVYPNCQPRNITMVAGTDLGIYNADLSQPSHTFTVGGQTKPVQRGTVGFFGPIPAGTFTLTCSPTKVTTIHAV